jgi:hypothetical protein
MCFKVLGGVVFRLYVFAGLSGAGYEEDREECWEKYSYVILMFE